ncbi:DUF551 domain-containing protein [Cronobacter sakazakii]|uniref:DUF551 domain-containing protein n=3 Tax=Cronobacter sakazakii TaxID=28141 RepID=UPI002AA0D5F1|nr:DUF551 domain-containing protein [Cronobacter sakazakii]
MEGEALRERAEPAYYLNQIDYGDGEGFELRAYFREVDAMKSKDDFGGVVIPAYTAPPATDKVADTAVCPKCGNTGLADSGGVQPWGEPILIECDCTAPPAPDIADDSLPYDPQIAEYEQMMEAEQAQADTTAQQFESLAGKAVVPISYLQGHKDGLEWAARLAEANHPQTSDWLYDDPLELAKAIRKGPDMPVSIVDGWIPCSERMPEVGDIVLTADNGCVNVGEMERSGASYRYFTSVVSGRELPATHWQPLPEPPCK